MVGALVEAAAKHNTRNPDRPVIVAFEEVKRIAKTMKILGSYAAP